MRKGIFFLFFYLILAITSDAQYTQLVENRGEIGLFQGMVTYQGDISPKSYFFNTTYGGFYKKALNDYVGIRFNYERITLQGDDNFTSNYYVYARKASFERVAHEASIMLELHFLKFIEENNRYRFTPYLSFGVGGLKSISSYLKFADAPHTTTASAKIISFPINFGFKYNFFGSFNIFGEATYRFTNTDNLDFLSDDGITVGNTIYQGSASGNDRYFSFKSGLSYNLQKIYGPELPKKTKKKSILSSEASGEKTANKKGFFSFFKRH
jgi:hypothetical protein